MSGYITPQEISTVLGIGSNAAYELIKTEGFPSIPIGERYIVPRAAFENWVSNPELIANFKRKRGSADE